VTIAKELSQSKKTSLFTNESAPEPIINHNDNTDFNLQKFMFRTSIILQPFLANILSKGRPGERKVSLKNGEVFRRKFTIHDLIRGK
jgi:hypothetical protein